jgi:hypothetical protein
MIKLRHIIREGVEDDMAKKRIDIAYKYFIDKLGLGGIRKRILPIRHIVINTKIGEWEQHANVVVKKDGYYQINMKINDTVKLDDRILDLAHEMVHIKQIEDGRLDIVNRKYNGVYYAVPLNEKEYLNLPWEIDARLTSKNLVIEFNRYMRDKYASKKKIKIK